MKITILQKSRFDPITSIEEISNLKKQVRIYESALMKIINIWENDIMKPSVFEDEMYLAAKNSIIKWIKENESE